MVVVVVVKADQISNEKKINQYLCFFSFGFNFSTYFLVLNSKLINDHQKKNEQKPAKKKPNDLLTDEVLD